MNVSDSLYAVSLPRLFLSDLPAAHDSLPERIGPLLFLTVLSLHTTPVYPGGPFGTSPYHIAETVPSVLISDTVESLIILINAFSGLHTGSWLPSGQPPFGSRLHRDALQPSGLTRQESRLPVVCKVPCVHLLRFVLRVSAGQFKHRKGTEPRYLHAGNSRYWWVADPSR